MCVDIDEAGCYHKTAGVDGITTSQRRDGDGGDASIAQPDIADGIQPRSRIHDGAAKYDAVQYSSALRVEARVWREEQCSRNRQRSGTHCYAVRQRDARNPVAASVSMSATSRPSTPYGCHASSVPSGRAMADVVGEPSLEQFTLAK